jgi:hypothetical protein
LATWCPNNLSYSYNVLQCSTAGGCPQEEQSRNLTRVGPRLEVEQQAAGVLNLLLDALEEGDSLAAVNDAVVVRQSHVPADRQSLSVKWVFF